MAAAGPRAMARSDDVLSGIHARRRCGRTDATAAGSSRSRKPRCGWPRPRWRTATPPCPSSVANSDHPRDALPVRRAAGRVARARREGPRPLNRSALDRDAARKCPKRAFTTHADRLRPRLESGRLPVAGPAARRATGADVGHVYHDFASGVSDDRPGLDSCGRALWTGDVLVVWKLDRLGRTLAHLVNTVQGSAALGCIKGPSVASKTEIPV